MGNWWDCEECGCQQIAGDLAACPMCGKEHDMPKINALTGPTQFDPDAAASSEQAPVGGAATPVDEHEPDDHPDAGVAKVEPEGAAAAGGSVAAATPPVAEPSPAPFVMPKAPAAPAASGAPTTAPTATPSATPTATPSTDTKP